MTQPPLVAVIDDDAGMRLSLDGLVRSIGYRVAMFDSAEAFLDAPEAGDVSCVISDVQMPGIGGIMLAHKTDASLRGRIILISAHASDIMRADAARAGVRHLLLKPFDADELIACLEAIVAA